LAVVDCADIVKVIAPQDGVSPPSLRKMSPVEEGAGYSGQDANTTLSDTVLLWGVWCGDFLSDAMLGTKGVHSLAEPLLATVGTESLYCEIVLGAEPNYMFPDNRAGREFIFQEVHPPVAGTAVHQDQVVELPPLGLGTDGTAQVKMKPSTWCRGTGVRRGKREAFGFAGDAGGTRGSRWGRWKRQTGRTPGQRLKGRRRRVTEAKMPKGRQRKGKLSSGGLNGEGAWEAEELVSERNGR
jgi:hypothetical protein